MSVSSVTNRNQKKYRIVFLGDQSVGKTSIIQKYTTGRYDETHNSTVGIDFNVRDLVHGGQNYRLQMWDTAGQQRYRSLIPTYLKNAHFAVFVYDITKPSSLQNIKQWYQLFRQHQDAPGLLVGNKIDLEKSKKTRKEDVQLLCQKLKLDHIQCSAKTGKKIEEMFLNVVQKIAQRQSNEMTGKYFINNANSNTKSSENPINQELSSKKDSVMKLNKEIGKQEKQIQKQKGCCG